MAVLKVRPRGQITVPKEIRDSLGIEENGNLLAYVEGNQLILKPLPPTTGGVEDLIGLLPQRGEIDIKQARREAQLHRGARLTPRDVLEVAASKEEIRT